MSDVIFYERRSCSTCTRAREALRQQGVRFEARDIFKQPLSHDEIRALTRLAPAPELFSWRSPTARKMGIQPGSLDDDGLIAAMAAEPRLIRRPLTVAGGNIIIGADLARLASLA
jgi:arsenate reductase-like glutaredoxin family protein